MIFLYHSIIPDDNPKERLCAGQALKISNFAKQIELINRNFLVVPLDEYIKLKDDPRKCQDKVAAITFDDGSYNTYKTIYPLIIDKKIPVTIFLSSLHIENGPLLWFNQLRALCFENIYPIIESGLDLYRLDRISHRVKAWNGLRKKAISSGDPIVFVNLLLKKYPINFDAIKLYGGMSRSQIRMAIDCGLFEIGAHTISHPFLPKLSIMEQQEEIVGGMEVLQSLTGKPIRFFAYPAGEYNSESIKIVKKAGFEAAFAIISKNLGEPNFEIDRVGIYSPSLIKLWVKMKGNVELARKLGVRIG